MRALILVDIQNDFLPGGALAVPRGDEVVAVANRLSSKAPLVVATQDWHPSDHLSFATQHAGRRAGEVIDLFGLPQVLWPDHCVQGSRGAAFSSALDMNAVRHVFPKGTDRQVDSYSGFFDNGHRKSTGMDEWLRGRNVDEVVVVGLATDYCVKATALDARALGFRTFVVPSACRAVDLRPDDGERSFIELRDQGVLIIEEADAFAGP